MLANLDIYATWRRLSRLPKGKWLFSKLVGWTAPYSGSIAAQVIDLSPGRAELRLRDRHRVRNHLGSIHAIALINLGEFCSGLALYAAMPTTHRGIISAISMRYLKKARGAIRARCEVAAVEWRDEDCDACLVTELFDQAGDKVAIAEVNWRLGLKNRVANTLVESRVDMQAHGKS